MSANFTPNLNELKNVSNFRFWCQKVLPLVYDDSLSYYELLCKVVSFLNDVISNGNMLAEDMENLHKAYTELQKYVNDYFDNLDVQEEINNKLDKFAIDGTLSNLITPTILSTLPPLLVDSVEEMNNINKLYILKSNSHVYVYGNGTFVDTGVVFGGTIGNVITNGGLLGNNVDYNDLPSNMYYLQNAPYTGITNIPQEYVERPRAFFVYTYEYASIKYQIVEPFDTDEINSYCRVYVGGAWKEWLLYKLNTKNTYAYKGFLSVGDLNDVKENGCYFISSPNTITNLPVENEPLWLETYSTGGVVMQRCTHFSNGKVYFRYYFNQTWGTWVDTSADYFAYKKLVPTTMDLNDLVGAGYYFLSSPNTVTNPPAENTPFWIEVYSTGNIILQRAIHYLTGKEFVRTCVNGDWRAWVDRQSEEYHYNGYLPSVDDLDNYKSNGYYFISSPNEIVNVPVKNEAFWLEVYSTGNIVMQRCVHFSNGSEYFRYFWNTTWSSWKNVTKESAIYNKNITQNSYTNTYNITTNPTFSVDNHGYLNAIDNEDTLEENATDMTGAILSLLNDTGCCKLGAGTFYVSGNIELPSGSTIEGCGDKTVVRLLGGYDNYIFRPVRYSIIKNMRLSGGKSYTPIADIGGRNGVYFYDTKVTFGDAGDVDTRPCIIENVFFDNFSGSGIYGYGTGGGTSESLIIDKCVFDKCCVGVNFDFFNEYCKINNIITQSCYYACINNGGNNVFTGCTFHGTVGFVIDNTNGDKINNGHGSCVGCTFNHIGNNTGYAIQVLGTANGFLFSGSQMWYGKIKVSDSKGVVFNGLIGGGYVALELDNNTSVLFSDMMVNVAPEITKSNNTNLIFSNCYNFITGDTING